MQRGFWAIGIEHTKTQMNVGTLWRSAHNFGAGFIFTVGRRYSEQCSDVTKAWRSVPLFHFSSIEDLQSHLPYSCPLIGVELSTDSRPLRDFCHPERACYLLGAEDRGLSTEAVSQCHALVQIPGLPFCLNVSTVGSIVMYDRWVKSTQ